MFHFVKKKSGYYYDSDAVRKKPRSPVLSSIFLRYLTPLTPVALTTAPFSTCALRGFSGSFWLNIGDSYKDKQLLNIPYRVAIRMQDEQQWILRNTVVWDKVKGAMSRSKDSLGCEYEPVFHFVKKKSGVKKKIKSLILQFFGPAA